jgi:hypothetical protein
MKLFRGAITALAAEGRITLQVPELIIGLVKPVDYEEYPDAWFERRSSRGVPAKTGFLFLTRDGWAANREAIKAVFCASQQIYTWTGFVTIVEKDLDARDVVIEKEIRRLKDRLKYLTSL